MTLDFICTATGGRLVNGWPGNKISSVITDSRKIEEGCLFVALKGETFDGHAYVSDALSKGAAACVVADTFDAGNIAGTLIKVPDTLVALGKISAEYRKYFFPDLIKVAVTGSVGKTSTKEMVAHVLSAKYTTCKTPLNFNNEIGLPMTLLSLKDGDEALVAEMGMRGFGQIAYLTQFVEQNMTVITNIGSSHLELLGTRENILKAKMENTLAGVKSIPARPYRLIVNGDNDLLSDTKNLKKIAHEYGCRYVSVITFGTGEKCLYRATDIKEAEDSTKFTLLCDKGHFTVNVPVPGMHNVYNAMAAICTGVMCGMNIEDAVYAVSTFGGGVRQEIIRNGNLIIMDDAYNASPESVRASVNVLKNIKADCRIAALGDMLELGNISEKAHYDCGVYVGERFDGLYTVGKLTKNMAEGFLSVNNGIPKSYATSAEAADAVAEEIRNKLSRGITVAVLVKGSHAMNMGVISKKLKELDVNN